MNLIEKLETRYAAQIVFPDELAREAAIEIKRLRRALEKVTYGSNMREMMDISKEALMQQPETAEDIAAAITKSNARQSEFYRKHQNEPWDCED